MPYMLICKLKTLYFNIYICTDKVLSNTSLKVYRKWRLILNENETNSTEYDAFSKLWSEIIEDAFGSKTRIV